MLNKLESQKNTIQLELSNLTDSKNPIEKYIEGGLALLSNLPKIYTKSDYTRKRSIIGSIITDKMIISDSECRTTNLNKVVELFSRNNGGYEVKKKGTKSVNSDLSPFVPRAGIEPAHLAVLDFESSASTNSATWAWTWNRKKSVSEGKDSVFIQIANLFPNIFLILEVFF